MAWIAHETMGKRLRAAIDTNERMPNGISVLRAKYDRLAFQEFVSDTLLIRNEDRGANARLARRLAETVALPCKLPTPVAAANSFEIHPVSAELARWMGVDPVRLLLGGFDATARVSDGVRAVQSEIKRAYGQQKRKGRKDRLLVTVTLSPGVAWKAGVLGVRNMVLPDVMMDRLEGRPVSDVIEHDWTGWADIRILEATRSSGGIIFRTDGGGRAPI